MSQITLSVGPDSFLHPLPPENSNKSSYETLCSFLNPRLRTNSGNY